MIDKAPEAGWVVQVTMPPPPPPPLSPEAKWPASRNGGPPSFKYFNAAIADAVEAIAATVKQLAEPDREREMRVVRGLSSGEIAALGLTAGQVKPA